MNHVTSAASWVPAHVPAELVWDHEIDAFARGFEEPHQGVVDHFHAGPDIVFARAAFHDVPGWILTRYELVEEAFGNHEIFSSADWAQTREFLGVNWAQNPLEFDPPQHTAYRMVLQPWFSPGAINKREATVRQICRDLIAKFEDRGGCEFISEFASLFPSYVFLSIMGMPEERLPEFLKWEDMFIRGKDPATRLQGLQAICKYLEGYTAERRANPTDDLVSHIVTAKIGDRLLDEGEVMGMSMVLYLGGLDTVLSSLGWYFRHLAKDQALQARLREHPEDIPAAVEEFLRAFGITGTRRRVAKDCEFHGVTMKKGDWVAVPTFLAGRDAREYANPHVIDVDRNPRHLTLARGVHVCLGAHLARREIRIVLEEFLGRFAKMRVPEGEQPSWHIQTVWGVDRLPLVWDR